MHTLQSVLFSHYYFCPFCFSSVLHHIINCLSHVYLISSNALYFRCIHIFDHRFLRLPLPRLLFLCSRFIPLPNWVSAEYYNWIQVVTICIHKCVMVMIPPLIIRCSHFNIFIIYFRMMCVDSVFIYTFFFFVNVKI